MEQKRSALIYYDYLLPYSATFVVSQAEALSNFNAYYAGSRQISGIELPKERVFVVNKGGQRFSEFLYKVLGFSPHFFQTIKGLSPSVIHAHFGPNAVRALPLVRYLNIPLIVTFHGYDVTVKDEYMRRHGAYSHKVYLRKKESLKREAHIFIAVSKFIEKCLLQQGFPSHKVKQHYIGIDLDFFNPIIRSDRNPIILFVARLVEKKGCEYLIRAMNEVQKVDRSLKLVIVGDGPLRTQLESQARRSLRNYEFLGVQSPESVRELMSRSKLFCVPSITAESGDAEAFGMVFAEAQAMGLPVVSFNSGGISEVVIHGKTGFLASERNWEELAHYIITISSRRDLWTKFSTSGRQIIERNFNLEKQNRELEDIYNRLLLNS